MIVEPNVTANTIIPTGMMWHNFFSKGHESGFFWSGGDVFSLVDAWTSEALVAGVPVVCSSDIESLLEKSLSSMAVCAAIAHGREEKVVRRNAAHLHDRIWY